MATIIYNKKDYSVVDISLDDAYFRGLNPDYAYIEIKGYGAFDEDGNFIGKKPNYLKDITDDKAKIEGIRRIRNSLLDEVDWMVMRHRSQRELLEMGAIKKMNLSEEKFKELLKYRQDLRDLTNNIDVNKPVFPVKPNFIQNPLI